MATRIATAANPVQDQAEQLGHHLPPLLVEADRVAATVAQGLHGRRRAGTGETFWQYRRFQPGDTHGAVDWRKSARRDHLLIRENEWEAANTVWFWVDRSPSMAFKSHLARTEKRERAILLALALATLLVRAGERVGEIGGELRASASRSAVRRMTEHLLATPSIPDGDSTSLPPRLALPRFSNLVLISDFLDSAEVIGERLAAIAGRDIRGHLVCVLDPAEETLPYRGRTEFTAKEGGERLTVGRAEALRPGYLARLAAHKLALENLCRRLGWSMTLHHTEMPPQVALLSIYAILSGHLGGGDPYRGPRADAGGVGRQSSD